MAYREDIRKEIYQALNISFPEIKELRKEQLVAITEIIQGRKDLVAVLPTGFGKSLIYQLLPTLHQLRKDEASIVAVITPLQAITEQQVTELCLRKMPGRLFKAASLDEEGLTREELKRGNVDVVFGSAEKWLSKEWKQELQDGALGKKISEICVDEAHSVIEWGTTMDKNKAKGKDSKPFREAFGRIGELRSLLPKCPLIALSASIRLRNRKQLQKVLAMDKAAVVDMSPNRANVRLSALFVKDSTEALNNLNWLIEIIAEKKEKAPKTIIFCNVLTDIAHVLSYFLMKLGSSAFITLDGKKIWLLAVYHSQTWDATKSFINEDFRIADRSSVRIVIATTSLSMGVNFSDVRYIIHFQAPARSLENHVQQLGRAGRDGNPAHDVSLICKTQLKNCEKDIQKIFKDSDSCLRVALIQHFDESVKPVSPKHSCCSSCAKTCQCAADKDGCNSQLDLPFEKEVKNDTATNTTPTPSSSAKCTRTRLVTEEDEDEMRKALTEEQNHCTLAEGGVTIFGSDTLHGFSVLLIEEVIKNLASLFSSQDILELLPVCSVKHARVILELVQEFFNDIKDYEEQIEMLCEAEIKLSDEMEYFALMEMFNDAPGEEAFSLDDIDSIDFDADFFDENDILPEFELTL